MGMSSNMMKEDWYVKSSPKWFDAGIDFNKNATIFNGQG